MSNYKIINAVEDKQRYIDIFNKHTKSAPYTIPLTMALLDNHVLKAFDENKQLCLIGKNLQGEGIIHAGLYQGEQDVEATGQIYAMLGDNNNIAEYLLRQAEEWFRGKKINLIRFCNWRPNPYKHIMYGSEAYVWSGSVPALNAFRRLDYDLIWESVVMICKMDSEPVVPTPEVSGLTFTNEELFDNDLVHTGVVKALIDGKVVGSCNYDYLKAISSHFRKPTGQIAIWTEDRLFGIGIGKALLLGAHKELYKLGARQVMLHTTQCHFRAIKLYEKLGYKDQNISAFCFDKEFSKDF